MASPWEGLAPVDEAAPAVAAQGASGNAPPWAGLTPVPDEAPPQKSSGSSAAEEAGKFGATALARGLGGLVDFAADPLSPLRRLISPSMENIEQSGKPHLGQAAGDAFFKFTGIPESQPESSLGRIGLAGAEGLVGGGAFGPAAAALGALGGLAGQGTREATSSLLSPENSERAGIAASLLPAPFAIGGRAAINYGVNQGKAILGPALSQGYRENMVGNRLLAGASDPEQLQQTLQQPMVPNLVPGSQPTTYQYTGDLGLGQMERGQRTLNNEPFQARAGEQNAARVDQLGGLAPEGATSGAVRDVLKQQLDQITQEGDKNVAAARQNAQQAFDQSGGKLSPEDQGALMRDQLEAAKTATKRQESALWQAIDPEGKLTINAQPVGQEAGRILSEIPKTAKPPEGEEATVFSLARMGGTAQPFQDFTALRGRLLGAIRDERENGQTPALRRMQMLRSAMDDTISETADKAANKDPVFANRFAGWRGDVSGTGADASTAAAVPGGGGSGTRFEPIPQGGPPNASGILGAAGDSGVGPGGAPGAAGISSGPSEAVTPRPPALPAGLSEDAQQVRAQLMRQGIPDSVATAAAQRVDAQRPPIPPGEPANFDAAASARYRAAADATRQRADLYNNQTVGPALQERGNEYRLLESRVPERFMSSTEGARAFIDAGGKPETLHDSLVMDLRRSATNPDGSLNVGRYQSWINKRTDALSLFPDLKDRLANVAGAQESVDGFTAGAKQQRTAFDQSAARHFIGSEPMQAVRSALSGKTPEADMAQLNQMVASDPAGKAGLQRALADYITQNFLGNAEVGTTGVAGMKSDMFQTFLKRNGPAIARVFSLDQMQALKNIADDLQLSARSVNSKIPGQSNTAQDLALTSKSRMSVLRSYLGPAITGVGGAAVGYLFGDLRGAAEGLAVGAGVKRGMDNFKAAGIQKSDQLLTEALLNPDLARALIMKATPANQPFIAAKLNAALGRMIGAQVGLHADEGKR